MSKILAFDPSGNFKEGKGTTGICLLDNGKPTQLWEIEASEFSCAEQYWNEHINNIRIVSPEVVVIEGYRLYNHKGMAASTQANSELETPQLIGLIKWNCWNRGIPLYVQYASEVKQRWKESVLVAKGYLEEKKGNRYYFNGSPTNSHKRDALKHALHYWRYRK